MEHRLIQGGEQYLPFARSCVAKLKKLGLPYADQSFEVEGASIRVRIEPGHEFIRIEDIAPGTMDMDSGVLEPGARAGPTRFLPGTFYETTHAKTYNARYQIPKDGGWRAAETSRPEPITGRVKSKGNVFSGLVRYDASESRALLRHKTKDSSVPPAWVDDPEDQALVDKKLMMHHTPASVFTGRCRMYVQAMYGRPTYSDPLSQDPTASGQGEATSSPTSGGYGVLVIPAFVRKGDTPQPDVGINTSSGVFLDPDTGRHWLFSPIVGSVTVYPLISSPAGELWRKYLKSPPATMTDDDVEHLEATILSECRPDAKNARTLPIALPYVSSMGYGLHWNWTGLAADIVVNGTFDHGDGYTAMESSHYRLVMTPGAVRASGDPPGPTRVFTALATMLEGPTQWAVQPQQWCIAEPLWVVELLIRSTAFRTRLFNCDAPFYVFYHRDELKLCRVKVTVVDHPIVNVKVDMFGDTNVTIGLRGGSHTIDGGNITSYDAVFSVGDFKLPTVTSGFFSNKYSLVVSGKTVISKGYVVMNGTTSEGPILCEYTVTRRERQEQLLCQLAFAIPYNDAECVYVRAFQDKVTTIQPTVSSVQQDEFQYGVVTNGVEVITDVGRPSGIGARTPISQTVVEGSLATVREFDVAYQFGKAGTVPATVPDGTMSEFFGISGEITDAFITYSGVRTSTPVVFSGDKGATTGTGGHDSISRPVLIGWV